MLTSLQAGRALAALAVIAYHLSSAFGDPRYGGAPVFDAYTSRGNLGVDFFFVLSGFIILHAHARDIGSAAALKRYAYNRFVRVYPVYWVYSGVFIALLLLGLGQVAKPPQDALSWISAVTLLRLNAAYPPLQVAWTLFHEVLFYAAFGLLIFKRSLGVLVLGSWALICAASAHYEVDSPLAAFTAAYNLNFLFGMAAYWAYRKGRFGAAALGAGICLVGAALAVERALGSPLVGLAYGVGFGLAVAGAAILETARGLKAPALLAKLGDASYSIYLVHLPVIGLLLKLAGRLRGAAPDWALYAGVFVATTFAGWLAYELVERRLIDRLRGRSRERAARRTATGVEPAD